MEHLYDKLKAYGASDFYPCHMPGHKRNLNGYPMQAFYGIDITEIDGFDNLHKPEGILRELMDRAGSLYGAETYLLVNGSTGGILSALSAVLPRGGTLLMARNCHKSVYHGVYLNGYKTEYIFPSYLEEYGICGAISPKQVRRQLAENPQIGAVFLTSPTYDGVASDVEAIAEAAHERGIPVIVDAAHGAHFFLDERFPKDAVAGGADIVIHSIHKTLPALTQTALLHVQGDLIDRTRLRRFLQIYQTSSPSYILLAGIEQCISILENEGKALCDRFFAANEKFAQKTAALQKIKILSEEEYTAKGQRLVLDAGKKILSVRGTKLTGQALHSCLLQSYHLQMEMAGVDYVTAIMTIADSWEGFLRLADALLAIDKTLLSSEREPLVKEIAYPEAVCDIFTAMEAASEQVPLLECAGRVSEGFIQIYPPGIPLIVPGEIFTEAVRERLMLYRRLGLTIEGMNDQNQTVTVIRKETYA